MKSTKTQLLVVLAVAFLLRLVYIATLDDLVFWEDEYDYLELGKSLAEGRGFVDVQGRPTAFRPLGYPLLLAALNFIGCERPSEIRLVHSLLGSVAVYFVFKIAALIMPPSFALAAALYAAVYPYFIFMTGTLFANLWFSVTLLTAVYALFIAIKKGRVGLSAPAGALIGVSTLSVTTAGILAPITLLWLFWTQQENRHRTFRHAAVFFAAFLLVVLPWMARNALVLGVPTLSTNGGRNLWLGNNPAATYNTGSNLDLPPDLEQRLAGASETEADKIYTQEAKMFIKAHPLHFVRLSFLKGAALWRFDPSPTTDGYDVDPRIGKSLSILTYTPILLLALYGVLKTDLVRRKEWLLWLLYFAAFTCVHAVFISKVRFRLPLDHFLMIMAAGSMQKLIARFKAARTRRIVWKMEYDKEHALV
ncbi:MAG: glycosyltransferase family 39 protein [candidate division KSB1 bacterium]|nr:glycosyltransferase family 39 protein [candidate division KSB1 bacterium]MDZ7346299.1 glycosyltransferase family 39 protein [candidate division KSB1 bacterium]